LGRHPKTFTIGDIRNAAESIAVRSFVGANNATKCSSHCAAHQKLLSAICNTDRKRPPSAVERAELIEVEAAH
jgi:hypothetical protein